jgi:hypothetical protein
VTQQDLIAHLRAQPEDHVISWYCDGMAADKPWDNAWVDVMIDDKLAWVITSGLLDEEDPDEPDDFVWPPDMVGHCLHDPTAKQPFVGLVPTPLNEPVPPETIEEIRWAASKVSSEAFWTGVPCWSAAEVNRAIEDWCMIHIGRPMQARWDVDHGPSPQYQQALDLMDAMKAGIEPKYLVHPGEAEGGEGYSVYVSEQVMDMLMREMAEPEE